MKGDKKKYYWGTEKKFLSSVELKKDLPLSNLLIFPPLPTSIHPLFSNKTDEENIITEETIKEEVPLEILNKIIEFSDGKSLFNLSQVSKEVRQLCLSENEKYKEKYLSSYYPLNNQYIDEFMEALEGEDFLYEDIEAAKALYSTPFNSHSTCDPHFNHLFFWKDLFHLRVHLQPYQANPCDWLYTPEEYDRPAYCDPRLCEFFRISQKSISENNNKNTEKKNNDGEDNEEEEDEENEEEEEDDEEKKEEDFYEVELVAITRTLHPIRLLVRSGLHPSVSKSQMVQNSIVLYSRYPVTSPFPLKSIPSQTDDDINKDYFYGREVKRIRNQKRDNENNNKKKKIEFEGFESEEEDEEDKEICKKLGIFSDNDENNDRYNDRDVPSCPCTPDCTLGFDIFIWNYKKQRYEHFFRNIQCSHGCDPSLYPSRSAKEWEGIFCPKVEEPTEEENHHGVPNPFATVGVSQLALAALVSSGIPLNEVNYQGD